MKLLFEDVLTKLKFTGKRVQKFKGWIENANKGCDIKLLDARTNQYDKAEELVSFYTFAPLELMKDKKELIQEILSLVDVNVSIEGEIKLAFERQFTPPKGYLEWFKNKVAEHPIKYIREQGKKHIEEGKLLETNTHIDVVLESDNLLILVEMKFTSDISTQTTFNTNRNQLARMIDVGISEIENKTKNKKLIILLCSPSEFNKKKSRLFYYKIQEYSDFNKIKQDIEWRKLEEIEQHLLKVAWLPIEELIKIIYRNFKSPEMNDAINFFKERRLA